MTSTPTLLRLLLICLFTVAGLSGFAQANTMSNDRLQGRIETALLLSDALQDFPIAVHVSDSTVTLTGNVSDQALADLAEQVAHAMSEAKDINNDLNISPARPIPDAAWNTALTQRHNWLQAQMIAELRLAITESPALVGAGIEIEIDGETAILRGTVSSETSRMVASQLAQNLNGIAVVNNRLEVEN